MKKVIRIYHDPNYFTRKTYNNILRINNELAIAENLSVLGSFPKRKQYRKEIIVKTNKKANIPFKVSHRDIKRLEVASKCEISVNSAYILETIIEEIVEYKSEFRYRAPDNEKLLVYEHMLNHIIVLFKSLFNKYAANMFVDEEEKIIYKYYEVEVKSLMNDLVELGKKYPFVFNEIFD